jgi:GT2 family glycosyltransferase
MSVNLLTQNGRKFVRNCLDAIFLQGYRPLEILIMDNDSTDGTGEFIEQHYPSVRLIKNKKNIGFGAGYNELIKQSRGEFVLCINQDTVLDKKIIENAVRVFLQDPKIGAIQTKVFQLKEINGVFQKSKLIDTTGLLISKSRQVVNRGQGEEDQGQFNQKEEIFGADGAIAFFRRAALEDVKLPNQNVSNSYEYFDEDFFAYKEDIDLTWRLRLAGWKTRYVPQCIGWHARTFRGENLSPWKFVQQRRYISLPLKHLSFKNHRLTLIKNEIPWLFFKHLPWIIPREVGNWIYVLGFEKGRWKAIKGLFQQIPSALKKRKIIMANRKIDTREMNKWFL